MSQRRLRRAMPWVLTALLCASMGCRPDGERDSVPTAKERATSTDPAAPPELPGMDQAPEPVRELVEAARAAVEEAPRGAQAWGELGMVLDAHEAFDEAQRCYEEAGRLEPQAFHWAYLDATMRDFTSESMERVTAAYGRAAELNPRFAPLYLRWGLALMRFGEIDEAIARYRRALELDPSFAWALKSLGQAQLAAGDAEAAVESLRAAEKVAPDDATILESLQTALFQLGREEQADAVKARAEGKTADKSIPDPIRYRVEGLSRSTHRVQARLGVKLRQDGCRAALEDLFLLERLEPDSVAGQTQLGRCLAEVGRTVDAEVRLRKAVTLPDAGDGAWALLGRLLTSQGRFLEAAQVYEDMAEHSQQPVPALMSQAAALVQAGRADTAVQVLTRAEAAGASGAAFDHDFGTTLQADQRWEAAESRFRKALEAEPDSPNTHYNLALVLLQAGRREDAVHHLRRASQLSPGHLAGEKLRELGAQ